MMSSGSTDEYIENAGGLLSLNPDCSLKLLEEPAVYDRSSDELYFLSSEALDFLEQCGQGGAPAEEADEDFLDFCMSEGILTDSVSAAVRTFPLRQSPLPSLRYLLVHITNRCNLRCRHCFIDEPGTSELGLDEIKALADQLEAMQGLRLMLSGGEPLLHSSFAQIDEYLAGKNLRVILLTNGTLIDEEVVARLCVDEVQVSLDGMEKAHDYIRGPDSFDRAIRAIRLLTEAGVDVTVASMIHSYNLGDFPRMAELVKELGVRQWDVDLPVPAGRMRGNRDLIVEPEKAAPRLDLSFGGAIHDPFPGFACGAHLMAVMADGSAARCGFYSSEPVGHIKEGLPALWQKVPKIPLAALTCDCQYLSECRGGCRFRAAGYNDPEGPDLCQCYRYGVLKKT